MGQTKGIMTDTDKCHVTQNFSWNCWKLMVQGLKELNAYFQSENVNRYVMGRTRQGILLSI